MYSNVKLRLSFRRIIGDNRYGLRKRLVPTRNCFLRRRQKGWLLDIDRVSGLGIFELGLDLIGG